MQYKVKKKAINFSFIFVVIPFLFLAYYYFVGEVEHEHKYYEKRSIDDFNVVLIEEEKTPPYTIFGGTKMKNYALKFDIENLNYIRVANLQISKIAPEISLINGLAHDNPYELHVHVVFPQNLEEDDKLWLSIEKWDGTTKQIFWPVKEIVSN